MNYALDQGKRPYMEDRVKISPLFFALPNITLSYAVLCDGHSGSIACDYVMENIDMILSTKISEINWDNIESLDNVIRPMINEIYIELDKSIIEKTKLMKRNDGSTMVLVIIINEELFISHVGDSRAVISINNKAKRITEDHKPNTKRESMRIKNAGGILYKSDTWRVRATPKAPIGLAVSRSLGDKYGKTTMPHVISEIPEYPFYQNILKNSRHFFNFFFTIATYKINSEYDFLIICSDGVWDVILDQKAVNRVNQVLQVELKHHNIPDSLEIACRAILNDAINLHSPDNLSCIIIYLKKE